MAEETNQPVASGATPSERRGFIWTPRLIVWTIILVVLLLFILQNFNERPINILFWDFTAPLSVILLIFSVAGYLLGWLRPHFRPRRRP